jgi:tight adherence protein B
VNLQQIAIAVFAAIFTALVAVFLIAYNRLSARNRRLRERMRDLVEGGIEDDDTGFIVLRDQSYSHIPFLDRLLAKFNFARNLQKYINEAGLPTRAGLLILSSLALGAAAWLAVNLLVGIWWLSPLAGIPTAFIPYGYVAVKRRQRIDRFEELLPEAIDMIVNALKSGFSLESSLNMVAQEIPDPVGVEFAICYEEQNLGVELVEALRNMSQRMPSEDLLILTTAISIQKRSGGNLAEILGKIAAMIRERFQLRREVRIRTAQGRLSGFILVVLPIAFAVMVYIIYPPYIKILVSDPVGPYMVFGSVLLELIGIFVIRRVVDIKI